MANSAPVGLRVSGGRHNATTLRRLTKQQHGLRSVRRLHPGIVTVVQRFRSDLGLFVHLHVLATDGAFEQHPGGNVVFHPLTDLHERDLVRVLDTVAADVADGGVADELDVDIRRRPRLVRSAVLVHAHRSHRPRLLRKASSRSRTA